MTAEEWAAKNATPADEQWAAANASPAVTVKEHVRRKPTPSEIMKAIPSDVDLVAKAAPTAGAFIGARAGNALGAPLLAPGMFAGGVGGAGLGGGTGKAVGNLLEGRPLMEGVGQEAATQAAFEAGGHGAAKLASKGGELLAQAAFKATPEVAQTAIREGITATKAGVQKAFNLMMKQAGAERKIVSAATKSGIKYRAASDLANPVHAEVMSKLEGAPSSEINKLNRLWHDFINDNPGPIKPEKVLSFRKYNDNAIQALHAAADRGKRPVYNVENLWQKALADRSRELLRGTIPAIRDPAAYEKLTGNQTLPELAVKLHQAVVPAAKKAILPRLIAGSAGATIGGLAGAALPGNHFAHGSEGALLGAALSSPSALSHMALIANNPLAQQFLLNTPRGLGLLAEESQ
jgi:hypothetical protein